MIFFLVVNFDPAEIITAVKGYITHFFGCRECGQNFAQETENFNSFLVKPNDEVLYLWRGKLLSSRIIILKDIIFFICL